eukprot:scaffold659_cov329-Prasinococcus_capsulatus_cf.AAC.19
MSDPTAALMGARLAGTRPWGAAFLRAPDRSVRHLVLLHWGLCSCTTRDAPRRSHAEMWTAGRGRR